MVKNSHFETLYKIRYHNFCLEYKKILEMNKKGNAYIYRTSKSALNSISKNLSVDLKLKFGISVITIDPASDFTSEQVVYVLMKSGIEDGVDRLIESQNVTFKSKDTSKFCGVW